MDIVARLNELRVEQANGSEQLNAIVQREAELRATLLRIAGAIAILEELAQEAGNDDN